MPPTSISEDLTSNGKSCDGTYLTVVCILIDRLPKSVECDFSSALTDFDSDDEGADDHRVNRDKSVPMQQQVEVE